MKTVPANMKLHVQNYFLVTDKKRNINDISNILDLVEANNQVENMNDKLRTINECNKKDNSYQDNDNENKNKKTIYEI